MDDYEYEFLLMLKKLTAKYEISDDIIIWFSFTDFGLKLEGLHKDDAHYIQKIFYNELFNNDLSLEAFVDKFVENFRDELKYRDARRTEQSYLQ